MATSEPSPTDLHILGVRHHGPGSARRVVKALQSISPSVVLIEAPSDVVDLAPLLVRADARPPIALLTYVEGDADRARFHPIAEFSPEYQAIKWAVAAGSEVRFIDVPAATSLALQDTNARPDAAPSAVARDPIGELARAAGYRDGESWWRDVIEEAADDSPRVFRWIGDAMTALRACAGTDPAHEQLREAYMRRAIAAARKEAAGPVAVVCGAWHAPALREGRPRSGAREILTGLPKVRTRAPLAPWTSPRLALGSGYGAGVEAPAWNAHIWSQLCNADADQDATTSNARWLSKIAKALRERGYAATTDAVLAAVRLGHALAVMRDRPNPGFEELRDAAIACLCFGSEIRWREIEREVLIGDEVGRAPADAPLAPLLLDLERHQRKARLKPKAEGRELSLDLRTDSGLFRSTLLHRLRALDTPWGVLLAASGSRGTFRERWRLVWRPEMAVSLVENLVYGHTIEAAAAARLSAKMLDARSLLTLASLVRDALTAQAPKAAAVGVDRLERLAAQTSDCASMLETLPPISQIIRYGQARVVAAEPLNGLFHRLAAQAAIALPRAARDLDAAAARAMWRIIVDADRAIELSAADARVRQAWRRALSDVAQTEKTTPLLAGAAARLVYESGDLDVGEIERLLSRALSPRRSRQDAAGFFEGFFTGSGARLVHDGALRRAADHWLCALDEPTLIECLPLMRRVFGGLDQVERRRLFDAVIENHSQAGEYRAADGADALWMERLPALQRLLSEGARK
ncbi:MAG: DUF5682 family protein [Neomegalonema sp.]